MATVFLTIFTGAFPAITVNNTEVRVYAADDDGAIVASLNHAPPHLDDTWEFPGLERKNYIARLFEMNGATIVRQLGGDMTIVPGSSGGILTKATEQIEADVTTGFSSGVNQFTFDGTSGKEDWRGWDIATIDRIGQGPMKKDVDYSWNKVTGQFTLLQAGDLFGPNEWFNVEFEDQVSDATDSVPVSLPLFSTPKIKTANYVVSAGSDFGGLLILKPAGNYMELTFPDIATVVAGKLLTIEFAPSATLKCCKFIFQAGQLLDWLLGARPDLYICPNESISIYKFIDPTGPTSQWRVFNPYGDWTRVGENIADDNPATNVFNKISMDGSQGDILQHARFYNDFVENLAPGEVVNYDAWATGNNKYKFSLANSANPANAGKFMIADRRNTFERNASAIRNPGDFEAQAMMQHDHTMHGKGKILGFGAGLFLSNNSGDANNHRFSGGGGDTLGGKATADTNMRTGDTGGGENLVNNIAVRKYIRV